MSRAGPELGRTQLDHRLGQSELIEGGSIGIQIKILGSGQIRYNAEQVELGSSSNEMNPIDLELVQPVAHL